MEKFKNIKRRRFFGMKIGELCAVLTLIGCAFGYVASIVNHFDEKFASIDRRFESMDLRFDRVELRLTNVEKRLDRIEIDVKQTSGLLNNYLTWRFLYQHDPSRKNIEPRYDPNAKTLEFVDKSDGKGR